MLPHEDNVLNKFIIWKIIGNDYSALICECTVINYEGHAIAFYCVRLFGCSGVCNLPVRFGKMEAVTLST